MNTGELNMWARISARHSRSPRLLRHARPRRSNYPTRTITVIIPFAGGSASDVVSRIMLDKMSKNMGQPIVVENRPGAGGNSGTLQGARATPDGYTLIGGGSGPVAANLSLYKSLGYDPREGPGDDLAVRGLHHRGRGEQDAEHQHAQGTDRTLQGQSWRQLRLGWERQLAASRRRILPAGRGREIDARALPQHRPVRARPDRGTGAARLPVVPERRRSAAGQGRGSAGRRRRQAHSALPDTPTTAEAGLPQYKVNGWFALLAPGGTPKPILERLNKELPRRSTTRRSNRASRRPAPR